MVPSGNHLLRCGVLVLLLGTCGCTIGSARVVNHPPQAPRALNNFVTQLLFAQDLKEDGAHVFRIENPREGWLFFSADAWAGRTGDVQLAIAPEAAAGDAAADELIKYGPGDKKRVEAMRYLPAGDYVLRLQLKDVELNALSVRTIPIIIYDHFPSDQDVARYGRYDWHFLKRIGMLDSCNTIITHDAYGPFMRDWLGQGKHVIQNIAVPRHSEERPVTGQSAYEYFIADASMTDPNLAGGIADEFYPNSEAMPLQTYVPAIERIRKEKPGKLFFPYIAGSVEGLRPFVEPLLNSGCGFAYEVYLSEMRAETEARADFEKRLVKPMVEFKKYAPDFQKKCAYVMGFLCAPTASLNWNPAVNFKVHMDMQFHVMATNPALDGLAGVEEYRSSYCDEEYMRWCAKIFRHYCIEGNRDRLTADPYELNHIQNADFEDGLNGWTVEAAAPESVQVRNIKGYGLLQGRLTGGDNVLCMKRDARKLNVVSQQIGSIEPGRYYSVKMYAGNYGNVTSHEFYRVSLHVEGADLVPEENMQDIFLSRRGHFIEEFGDVKAFFNLHRVVFKATSETARLIITERDNPIGQEILFSFIEVEPYLMP